MNDDQGYERVTWWEDLVKKIKQQAEDEFARTHEILKETWERDKKQANEPQYFQGFRKLTNPQDEKETKAS